MKKLVCLAAALLAALALTAAAAAESQDARLARVTQAVKETLDLDTEIYTEFRGSCSEELVPVWSLNWEKPSGESLSVEALEDGTIFHFYSLENKVSPSSGSRFPTFPDRAEGDRAAAEAFLRRVLRPGETVEPDQENGGGLDASGYSSRGRILLNGLPSPYRYSLRAENERVVSFSRDLPESQTIGGVPGSQAAVRQADAAKALEETQELRLEYVRETDGRAVLQYVPAPGHIFYLDAGSGRLLDITELEAAMSVGAGNLMRAETSAPAAADTAAGEGGMTQAEQDGVERLEGVLSKEELDQALRKTEAFGLSGYALLSASYQTPSSREEDRAVRCTLRYVRTTEGERFTREITVDAHTGEAARVWSAAPWGRAAKLTQEEAQARAEAFLKELCPDRTLGLYEMAEEAVPLGRQSQERPDRVFTFVQLVEGVPYRENAYTVGIDLSDGSVYSLSSEWDDTVTFEKAGDVISPEAALAAWLETHEAVLAYRHVPQALTRTEPLQARLLEEGRTHAYALRLTYRLEQPQACTGIYAKSGEPVRGETPDAANLVYDDVSGSSARADIEKLAAYGVGYAGGSFRPSKTLTQWELVCLVSSLQGEALDPGAAEKNSRDNAYYSAYRLGLLRASERDDGAVVTRSALVRMLLDAAGYGPAARLEGVYSAAGYADDAAIPAGEQGYAAIARALGMASETYAGGSAAVRGEAASMICRLLERAV
ncbi:MAG: S-layer homology domain-containing protein [Oscillibacter sp.]|nr:S-layer homology domain-containing protein [Oscillibacter sp.]